MYIRDITLYFNFTSTCCTSDGRARFKSLVEPMPNPAGYFKQMDLLAHCDLEEFCVTYDVSRKHKKYKKTYYLSTNIDRERSTREYMKKYVKKFMKVQHKSDYCILMVPEFTSSGVLHWHGVSYIERATHFYTNELKDRLNRKYGRTCGKEVHNYVNYRNYMLKDMLKPTIHRPIYLTNMTIPVSLEN